MTVIYRILTIFLITAMFFSCTSSRVIGTWTKGEDQEIIFNKIAILGVSHSTEYRKIFEQAVEEQMLDYGYNAEGAFDFLPPNENEDNTTSELINAFFKSAKVDAVITLRLLEIDDFRRYVPGTGYFVPYYSTFSFYDHYIESYEYVYSPGYYTGELDVFLEANLFDFETGELLWSAQTETININNVTEIASSFAKVVVEDLNRSEVLYSSSKQ